MNLPTRPHALRVRPADMAGRGHAIGRPLAFLHIPKTAGTAFGAALAQRFAASEVAPALRTAIGMGSADPRIPHAAPAYRLIGVGPHLDRDTLDAIEASLPDARRLFVVTVLRDPRERLLSQFRHWQRADDANLAFELPEIREAYLASRRMPLRELLTAGIPVVEKHFQNFQARMLAGLSTAEHLDPAALLAVARQSLAGIDVVATTGTLDEAMACIADAYAWAPPDRIRPLNMAPSRPPPLDDATEEAVARFIAVDAALWNDFAGGCQHAGASPPLPRRHFRTDQALLDTILDGGSVRFTMADALDGEGWHIREGDEWLARWTGPELRSTIRFRTLLPREVSVALHLVSVLDWGIVEGTALTLDGIPPLAPARVEHRGGRPYLVAEFRLADPCIAPRELAIHVPYTRSHQDFDPGVNDARQKGLAVGDIAITARGAAAPGTLGTLFWEGASWSRQPPAALMDLIGPVEHEPPPAAERNLIFDLPVLKGILDLVQPDHVWPASPRSVLDGLARGTPTAWPAPGGRLAILATLFEFAGRSAATATLAQRFEAAVLVMPCAEDFRLRTLAAHPLLRPHLHMVGCTNAILVANLAGLHREGGSGLLQTFLLLLDRMATTTPEALAEQSKRAYADYLLLQVDAALSGLEALAAGHAEPRALLATLLLEKGARAATSPAAIQQRAAALMSGRGTPLALVDPALPSRLGLLIDHLQAVQPDTEAGVAAALAVHECAFRIVSILAGWQHFGLASNQTAILAQRLRAGLPAPPLYPKPLKPFSEYIDFYRSEARRMSAYPHDPGLLTPLDRLGGGLDHVVRLNLAAREIEVALRLLGDQFPGEEILWVDAGCSYGVIMNGVVPPANIRGRCSFLGFDFNAPAIEAARIVARNAGNAHCRFEVGDVAEARDLVAGRRIHLISAFEVLEHCPDPLAVLRDYRAMEPGMLVVGSPLSERQSIFPAEQHVWGFDAAGFTALATTAGFAPVGVNQRQVGHFVGGHDWVTVMATGVAPLPSMIGG
jgi:2-polyprenyl-3-methyl-5-hydroxy-6-metoxy-1,4-benzoquinol methylase